MKGGASVVALAVASAAGLTACRPALDDRPWLVTTLEILAVKADPPEAAPGDAVTLEAFALGPSPDEDVSTTAWSVCHAPKPLAENRVAAADCLAPAISDAVGNPVMLAIPTDACELFGPDPPQPAPGAPSTRPRDPDATGGYFQPITAVLGPATAVALERVSCDLRDASLAVARAYEAAYRPNQNPTIMGFTFSVDGGSVDTGALAPGARVTAEVSFTPDSIETFPVFDRSSGSLIDTQEVLTASFYVTGGALDRAAAEVSDPTVSSVAAQWTIPPQPSALEMLVVLRDSRGGTDVARARVSSTSAAFK